MGKFDEMIWFDGFGAVMAQSGLNVLYKTRKG